MYNNKNRSHIKLKLVKFLSDTVLSIFWNKESELFPDYRQNKLI